MKISIIGLGSMGRMLAAGLDASIDHGKTSLCLHTRSPGKARDLLERLSGAAYADSAEGAADRADIVILCVKPGEMAGALRRIAPAMKPSAHLVSIAGNVAMSNLEKLFNGKITIAIPSVTSEVREGITLLVHNRLVGSDSRENIEALFRSIGVTMEVPEAEVWNASELTSCAPGLLAALAGEFAASGARHSGLGEDAARAMVARTLFGTAKMLVERNVSFDEMVKRVATKGGITEEGVKIIRAKAPALFDDIMASAQEKRKRVREAVDRDFA